jgi:hypothetical protein
LQIPQPQIASRVKHPIDIGKLILVFRDRKRDKIFARSFNERLRIFHYLHPRPNPKLSLQPFRIWEIGFLDHAVYHTWKISITLFLGIEMTYAYDIQRVSGY